MMKLRIASALVVMLFLSMLGMLQAYAVSMPEIYLISSVVSENQKWSVQVWVKDVHVADAVFAYQVKLFFNMTFLQCIEARIPETDKSWIFSGSTILSPPPVINTVMGYAVVGASILKGTPAEGSGPFVLASFEFCVKAKLEDTPVSYVNVDNSDILF